MKETVELYAIIFLLAAIFYGLTEISKQLNVLIALNSSQATGASTPLEE